MPGVIALFVVAIIGGVISFVPRTTLAKWIPHGERDAAAMHEAATTGQGKR